jgi:tetratricopeptide (TPR) repeat protein
MVKNALEIWSKYNDQEGINSTYGILMIILVFQGRFIEGQMLKKNIQVEANNLEFTQSRMAWVHSVSSLPDIYLGKYEAARDQALQSVTLLKDVKRVAVAAWTAVTIDVLGRIALAEQAFEEAEDRFQECREIYQTLFSADDINQALSGLGYAARGLDHPSQAQRYFHQAMKQAIEAKVFLTLIHSLPGIALLFLDQGEIERAVELYALASTQGIVANSKWFADIAGDEIDRTAEKLPPGVIEAAKKSGRSLDLWETALELLDELEKLGWDKSST